MARSDKRRGIVLAVAALLLLAAGFTISLVVRSNNTSLDWAADESLEGTASAEDSAPELLTIKPSPNELVAPPVPEQASPTRKPGPTPTSPTSPAAPVAPTDPEVDPAWAAYLAETRQVVTGNAASLAPAGDRVMLALKESDRIALGSMLAPGEGDQSEYLRLLALKYPAIQSYSMLPTVNIYSVGGTTVYLTYALTTWEDGGIVSQHAIPIPLRFVDGQWLLTTLADTGSDPRFVQSVSL